MTPLEGVLLVSGFALVLVTLAGLIRFAEKLSPRFSRWLDRHFPEGGAWQ